MPKNRPYYALHQIETGKYTTGGEYYQEDGSVYIGPYHILPGNRVFTLFVPATTSVEVYTLSGNVVEESIYRAITKIKTGKYQNPKFHKLEIEDSDFTQGWVNRFFVQQKNNPRSTIIEVSEDQYNGVNRINGPGINGNIWRKTLLEWRIRGDVNSVVQLNTRLLQAKELTFPGISKYLDDRMEYISF